MDQKTRDDCLHVIRNATASIEGLAKRAILALGAKVDHAHVIPYLKEMDHYLWKIEAIIKMCGDNGNGCLRSDQQNKA